MAFVEIARERKFTLYRDNSDPSVRRAVIGIDEKYYQDASGAWQPVNESFVDDPVYGGKSCNTVQHKFQVANGGKRRWYPRRNISGEYLEITGIQYYSNRWRTLNLPTPVWRSNFVEWDMTNLYASVTHTRHRIKTDFILKNSSAYTRLRFAITLVGLTLDGWNLVSTTDSTIVGTIDPPTAVDATGADVPVTAVYSGGYIEWSVQTAGYTFPIMVDPTFTDGYGGDVQTYKDTYLSSTAQSTNYGTNTGLAVAKTTRVSLLTFDLSSISATATCNSATLTLSIAVKPPRQATACTLYVYQLASANADWVEAEADWDGKDNTNTWAGSEGCQTSGTDYNATALGSYSVPSNDPVGTQYDISLTAASVEALFGSTIPLLLMHDTDVLKVYASSDHATTGYRPVLVVDYTVSSGTQKHFLPLLGVGK